MSVSGPPYWSPQLETMPPAELRALDDARLAAQLDHLARHSPFYQRKLKAAGVAWKDVRSVDGVTRLPFTDKDELRASQETHPPLGDYAAVSQRDVVRVHSSSGTTGRPSYVGLTRDDSDGWAEMTARCLYATGLRPTSTIAYAFNIGFFCGGPANIDAIQAIGATLVPIGTGATDRLIPAIGWLGIDHLTCTPSYAQYLAERVRDTSGRDPRDLTVRRLMVGGEPGGGVPSTRDRIQADWDAAVFDAMGSADLAPVFLAECEAQAGMHFMGQGYLLPELVEPDSGASVPIEEGAEGELVVTHLRRECVPLVRFRTRDRVVVWTDPCPCGRTSFRLRCVGRTDDMLIVRGVNVFPSAIRDVVGSFRPQTTGEVLVELDRPGPRVDGPLQVLVEAGAAGLDREALAERIQAEIRARLVVAARVVLVPAGSLPRSEMKTQHVRVRDAGGGPPVR